MVSTFAKEQIAGEARRLGVGAVLVKPVLPAALLDTMLRLSGGTASESADTSARAGGNVLPGSLRGAHILLVEDHEFNQLVAREFMENAGLRVSVARDGREGVNAVLNGQFDAVLMDVHMPAMDGFEATRLIRLNPRFKELPIIAMTAAVMPEERAACQAAGMNDHLAKPLLAGELVAVLSKWLKPNSASPVPVKKPGAAPRLPGFDFAEVLGLLQGDWPRLRDLLLHFAVEFRDAPAELQGIMQRGDVNEAAALLHKIKGVAGNLGMEEVCQSAKRLEECLRSGSPTNAATQDFGRALTAALQYIATLGEERRAPLPAGAACRTCNHSAAKTLIEHLQELLDGSDFITLALITELKQALPCGDLHERLRQFENYVDKFDYGNARLALAELRCMQAHGSMEVSPS